MIREQKQHIIDILRRHKVSYWECLGGIHIDDFVPDEALDEIIDNRQVVSMDDVHKLIAMMFGTPNESNEILDNLEYDFNFVPFAPVVMTSSVTGKNVTKIFELAQQINKARHAELKTSDLNKLLMDAVASHPPAGLKNTHPKLRYMVQTDTCPPWFVVYGSNLSLLHGSYKRYLERRLRDAYDFTGTPIFFSFRNRD